MIPADSSIDDELPLFSINLNGKKRSRRYGHAHDTHIHTKKNNWCCPSPWKNAKAVLGPEDHRIRASRS